MDTNCVMEILAKNPRTQELNEELKIPYNNCFIALMVLHPKDPTKILIIDYYPDRDEPVYQTKFPGGTGEEEDITPFETLLREAKEEVLEKTPGAIIQRIASICKEVKLARNNGDTDHIRYGVVAEIKETIQPYDHLEGLSKGSDQKNYDELVKNHRYESVIELHNFIFPGHRVFFRMLCQMLAPYIPEYKKVLQKM